MSDIQARIKEQLSEVDKEVAAMKTELDSISKEDDPFHMICPHCNEEIALRDYMERAKYCCFCGVNVESELQQKIEKYKKWAQKFDNSLAKVAQTTRGASGYSIEKALGN